MGRIIASAEVWDDGSEFEAFKHAIDAAGPLIMAEIAAEGAELSRGFAPKGKKPDPRTSKLMNSIEEESSATVAKWTARARHALAQEFGASEHRITGYVSFWWEKKGRMWKAGPNLIRHPGHGAQPYLRPAFEITMTRALSIVEKYYP